MAKGEADYKAEWNMCTLDFKRYDRLLCFADEYGIRVRKGQYEFTDDYFVVLEQIYFNWRPLIHDKKYFDDMFKKAGGLLSGFLKIEHNTPKSERKAVRSSYNLGGTIMLLREIHKALLEKKQFIGLGVPVKRFKSQSSKLKGRLLR